ncbi:MAG: hypothetical protein LBK41_04140 [Clostridiales bacterium]|nr:hypothetical protein [Clostridiales bacterium]
MSRHRKREIPLPILIRAIKLLEKLYLGGCEVSVQCDYDAVLYPIEKEQDIEFSKIVRGKDEQTRHEAEWDISCRLFLDIRWRL